MSDEPQEILEDNTDRMKELYELFLEVFDRMIERCYIITDGITVSTVVMDKKVGAVLAKKMKNQLGREWGCFSVPDAIKYAFQIGHDSALMELYKRSQQGKETDAADGKTEELRDSDVQSEKE